jgi:hypothetical protein
VPMPSANAAPAGETGPSRFSRRSRRSRSIGLALVLCGLFAFGGWFLMSGGSDPDPSAASTRTGGLVCDASLCTVTLTPADRQLAREWRWERKGYAFDHMFREAPGTSRLAMSPTAQRAGRRSPR